MYIKIFGLKIYSPYLNNTIPWQKEKILYVIALINPILHTLLHTPNIPNSNTIGNNK